MRAKRSFDGAIRSAPVTALLAATKFILIATGLPATSLARFESAEPVHA